MDAGDLAMIIIVLLAVVAGSMAIMDIFKRKD